VGVGVLAVLTICSPCVAFGGLYFLLFVKWWKAPGALIGRINEILNPPPAPPSNSSSMKDMEGVLLELVNEIRQASHSVTTSSTQGKKHTLKY